MARLSKDFQTLDRGVLSYTQVGSLKTAATLQFEVKVTDAGQGPELAAVAEFDGMSVYQQDVPTGGIVGVQIVACVDLTCSSESDMKQPVLVKGQQAAWWWNITAGTPGSAMITLRADTYDQGSGQSLSEEIINVPVDIVATPSFNQQQTHKKIAATAKGVVGDIETIGSIAAAIVAVGGIVGWIIMMRRKRQGGKSKSEVSRRSKQPR